MYIVTTEEKNHTNLEFIDHETEDTFLSARLAARREERRQAGKQMRAARKKSTAPRRSAKTAPAIKWLRDQTCSLVFGEAKDGHVYPSLTIRDLIGRWNLGWSLKKLANYHYEDHFAGSETFYFFGNGATKVPYTLAMIDIDVQKSRGLGSPLGAKKFAEYLKTNYFPQLYFERSTGGKGIHAYVVIDKRGVGGEAVNQSLDRFQAWLRAEAKKVNADIEMVEVKGACPEIRFSRGMMESVKFGSFAKLPRENDRFDELKATTVLSWIDLQTAQYDVKEVVPTVEEVECSPVVVRKKETIEGSISGKFISMQDLAAIPKYEALYRTMIGGIELKAGKWSVTSHDFATAMVILRFFKMNPNADGSLPTARIEGMWQGLYRAGDVERPWNHHRWKKIRDFLSARGHIDWQSNRYEFRQRVNGKFVPGVACKWEITDEFLLVLESVENISLKTGGGPFMDTHVSEMVVPRGSGQFLIPEPALIRIERQQRWWQAACEACDQLCAA